MTFGGYVCIHFFELEAVSVHLYLEPQTKQHNIFQLTSRRDLACEFKALSKGSKNGSKPWKNTSTHMVALIVCWAPHGGSNVEGRPWVFSLVLKDFQEMYIYNSMTGKNTVYK